MNFRDDVLPVVRRATGHSGVKVPRDTAWTVEERGDTVALTLEVSAAALAGNMQENLPAAPFFALCLAWWFEHATARPTEVVVQVLGAPPTQNGPLLHWRRTQFLLAELTAALGPRFRVTPDPGWRWPDRPVLNAPLSLRSEEHNHDPLSEHALEVQIAGSPTLRASFPAPLARLHRQLPVGLFGERVSRETPWAPGGKSQVDLWGESPDGRVVHLIELKTHKNSRVGILPEALYYARLLHHLRTGRVAGGAPELRAVRKAERVIMWLVAPSYHPLVYSHGASPLAWVNAGMAADALEMRILPIALDPTGCTGWRSAEVWPSGGEDRATLTA